MTARAVIPSALFHSESTAMGPFKQGISDANGDRTDVGGTTLLVASAIPGLHWYALFLERWVAGRFLHKTIQRLHDVELW